MERRVVGVAVGFLFAGASLAQLPGNAVLREPPAATSQSAQRQMMADCEHLADQRQLRGSKRRDFLSECLTDRASAGASSPGAGSEPVIPPAASRR
jgi:hypothetical protein